MALSIKRQEIRAPPQILYNESYDTQIKSLEKYSMPILRQESLFNIQVLFDLDPPHQFINRFIGMKRTL